MRDPAAATALADGFVAVGGQLAAAAGEMLPDGEIVTEVVGVGVGVSDGVSLGVGDGHGVVLLGVGDVLECGWW